MVIEFSTRAILEEQRCAIVDQANFELNMQDATAEINAHNLTHQLLLLYGAKLPK